MYALITGASSGIGKELAALLASKGYKLILCGRDHRSLYEKESEDIIIVGDLTDLSCREEVSQAIQKYRPNLIINNAGVGHYGKFLEVEKQEHLKMIELNITAVVDITYEAIAMLQQHNREGKILNVSSVAGYFVFPYHAIYAATKAFVTHFSQSVNAEVTESGIRVLASCPGVVNTKFRERATQGKSSAQEGMTVSYAANRIWQQIESEKTVDIFDWRYTLMAFASHFFVPKTLSNAILKRRMKSYLNK